MLVNTCSGIDLVERVQVSPTIDRWYSYLPYKSPTPCDAYYNLISKQRASFNPVAACVWDSSSR